MVKLSLASKSAICMSHVDTSWHLVSGTLHLLQVKCHKRRLWGLA